MVYCGFSTIFEGIVYAFGPGVFYLAYLSLSYLKDHA
jgi:hypothetical protein